MRRDLALTAALVTTVLVTTAAAVFIAPAASAAPPAPRPGGRTVTLVTGDRVSTTGTGSLRIERAPGRQDVQFLTQESGGHQYVIPSDAVPLLARNRLDRRLFDITALLEFGYDRRADLPLIVTYASGTTARSAARSALPGARVDAELSAVDGLAVRASGGAFWKGITTAAGVSKVWLDGRRRVSLETSVPQIGAPTAWQAGYDGAGVTVAVLDTGVDAAHPDVAGQVAARRNFTEGAAGDPDRYGHGTHVASTVAGTGAASGGRHRGVAPGARLLDAKVCDDNGECAESWILAGMQWAVDQGADVVNLSLGGPDGPEVDPLEAAVNELSDAHGTLFVIAAGNYGPGEMTVASPGSADRALTVGAVDSDDSPAWFSSRGPRTGDGALKPDIAAPGVEIVAARSKDYAQGEPGASYLSMSGTSMATPHVAGAAAILAQRHPEWPAARLKSALMGAAQPRAGVGAFDQGAGRVDVNRAIGQTVTADPPGVGFGSHQAPHDDDPMPRTVTYTNHGDTDVTLSLSVAAGASPAGMFTVDADTVTVPAGGHASVVLTGDARVPAPAGHHTGQLVATSPDGVVVRTPVALSTRPLQRILTLDFTDHDGQPTTNFVATLVRLDGPESIEIMGYLPRWRLQVPAGRYALMAWMTTPSGDNWRSALLAQPKLDLMEQDATVEVDARLARPVTVRVPHASAGMVAAGVAAEMRRSGERYGYHLTANDMARLSTGQLGPDTGEADTAPATFTARVAATLAEPGADGTFHGSPYAYHLAWFSNGRMPTGFARTVARAQLATVDADHARHSVADAGKYAFAVLPGRLEWHASVDEALRYPLPFRRTEYFNMDGDGRWISALLESGLGYFYSQPTRYQAGHRYTERWNRGVFGPSMAWVENQQIGRIGDLLSASVPLFGDGAGRSGGSYFDQARVALYRDGALIEEQPYPSHVFMGLPAEEAGYRLESSVDRSGVATLSTRVSAAWTFRSAHVEGRTPLPLSTVVFDTGLDAASAAPAGRAYRIPVRVLPQPGSAAGPERKLTVQASFDDGATWRLVPVVGGAVIVPHPTGAGFVSLRAAATNTAGAAVEQTIIRAYRFASTP